MLELIIVSSDRNIKREFTYLSAATNVSLLLFTAVNSAGRQFSSLALDLGFSLSLFLLSALTTMLINVCNNIVGLAHSRAHAFSLSNVYWHSHLT